MSEASETPSENSDASDGASSHKEVTTLYLGVQLTKGGGAVHAPGKLDITTYEIGQIFLRISQLIFHIRCRCIFCFKVMSQEHHNST